MMKNEQERAESLKRRYGRAVPMRGGGPMGPWTRQAQTNGKGKPKEQ